MRRAIIHIGLPRTGTTTLQRILHDLRPRLAARGVLYPDLTPASAPEPHLSHQHLGETLDGRRPARERRELLAKLAAQLGDADVVLLSYESLVFGRGRRRAASRLAGFFRDRGLVPELLVTVKPQAEYLNSMYTWRTQFLRESREFATFAAVAIKSPQLRYDRLLVPWCVATDGRVTGVPLRDAADPAPFIPRLMAGLGLADRFGDLIGPAEAMLVENRSPGPIAVDVSRRLAHWRLPAGRAREITLAVDKLARARGETLAFNALDEGRAAEITQRFAVANDRFAAIAWGKPWVCRVGPAPSRAIADGRHDRRHETAVREILAEIVAAYGLPRPSSWDRRWRPVASVANVFMRRVT